LRPTLSSSLPLTVFQVISDQPILVKPYLMNARFVKASRNFSEGSGQHDGEIDAGLIAVGERDHVVPRLETHRFEFSRG